MMIKSYISPCITAAVFAALIFSHSLHAEGWVDVHFHIVGDEGATGAFESSVDEALGIMDDAGMSKIVIMSPPRPFRSFDIDEIIGLQQKYPGKIYVMGGGGTLNPMIQDNAHGDVSPETRQKFEAIAEEIIAKGAKGFGEIAIHHVSLNPGHGYESIPADSPLMLLLADIAAKHNVPIDIHFDPVPEETDKPSELFSPKNPDVFKENVEGFERLLAHNPNAKIVWAHAGSDPVGFYTPDLVRELMQKHPNLYCSIRTTLNRNDPMRHPMRGVNDDWIEVVKEFPDRFVMGTDSFLITSGYSGPNGPRMLSQKSWIQREGANEVLSYIDSSLAAKVGSENAIKIYNLQ
jgi:predicted TIM-barrel fold metal-dependent hydrolase